MNDNFGYIDIVLFAIVAGIIGCRLRSILGQGVEDSAIRIIETHNSRRTICRNRQL